MKIKDSFAMRRVAETFVVVPTGKAAVDFGGMMTLNEVGAFLWERLASGAEEDELVAAVMADYDVEESVARADTAAFLKSLRDAGVLE